MNANTIHKNVHSKYWGNYHTNQAKNRFHFRPPMLQYSYSALEKIADVSFLKSHFLSVHMKAFEDFLDLINGTKAEHMGMIQIFDQEDDFTQELVDTAGNVFNHQLYWDNLSPYGGNMRADFASAVKFQFESQFKLKHALVEMGMKHKNSGWLWLILNQKKELQIISTVRNENPLMHHTPAGGSPLLAIDLWEHAYFAKFRKDKEKYLECVSSLINWNEVSRRYRFAT